MSNKIKLQVGELQFITTKDTFVGESSYFSALLSGRWNDQDDDGFYFIDSDPAMFTEILRYLRSGNFPLFFDTGMRSYDYGKYTALLGEARYFGISKLEDWILEKRYLDAVTIRYSINIIDQVDSMTTLGDYATARANEQLRFSYFPKIKKIYICPRGISVHDGDPAKCGRQCARAQAGSEPEYEEVQLITAVVVKTHEVFNPKVCLGEDAKLETDTP
ncbi:hypothetical protein GGS24DRAFT_511710 [Hypoxylon argillaceum]|nr:hypothetical protein GGS24DRAFT_511710 [Hypoxylon argillaceum]